MANTERQTIGIKEKRLEQPLNEIILDGITYRRFEILQEFLRRSELLGVFDLLINSTMQSSYPPEIREEMRRRKILSLKDWAFNPELTQIQSLKRNGIIVNTRARAGEIIKKTIEDLWSHSHPHLQKVFPLSSLKQRKPPTTKTLESLKSKRPIRYELPSPRLREIIDSLKDADKTFEERQESLNNISKRTFEYLRKQGVITPLYRVIPLNHRSKSALQDALSMLTQEKDGGKDRIAVGRLIQVLKSGSHQGIRTSLFIASVDLDKAKHLLQKQLEDN